MMVPIIGGPCPVSTGLSVDAAADFDGRQPNKLGVGPNNNDPSPAPPGRAHWSTPAEVG